MTLFNQCICLIAYDLYQCRCYDELLYHDYLSVKLTLFIIQVEVEIQYLQLQQISCTSRLKHQ